MISYKINTGGHSLSAGRSHAKGSQPLYRMRNVVRPPPIALSIPEIHAVGLTTSKSRGEAAEAAFLAKAASLGFGVAKPWGDSERYDFIVDSGHNFWRVQVKSSQLHADSRYQIKTSGFGNRAYTSGEIDFIVAYIIPEDLWYVLPIDAIGARGYLRFYPAGSGRKSPLERYRAAWCQMACPRDEDGPSRIVVPRCCQQAGVCGGRCPLWGEGNR